MAEPETGSSHRSGDLPNAAAEAGDQLALIGALSRTLYTQGNPRSAIEQGLRTLGERLHLRAARILRVRDLQVRTLVTVDAQGAFPTEGSERDALAAAGTRRARDRLSPAGSGHWTPILGAGAVEYVLECWRAEVAPFTPVEGQLLAITGTILAGHLDRIRIVDDLREAEEDTLRALAISLAARDRYTGTHVEEVRIYAERLGQRLGMDRDDLRALNMGSILHDIGKIGVSDAILLKSGPLTEAEMAHMRQHTVIGAEMVRSVRRLTSAMPIILYHHERWDGKGYPSGLAGEAIPFAARIVAVADSFHAMTSARVYRPARPRQDAIAELRRGAGTAYDPRIVDSFITLIAEVNAGSRP